MVVLLTSCAHHSDEHVAQRWIVSDRLAVETLRPGVWLHTSWHTFDNGARFPANGLLVRAAGELVLIDTAWGDDATVELLAWIEDELELPLAAAFVTHFHDDSAGGRMALASAGVPLFAHPRTVAIIGAAQPDTPTAISDFANVDAVTFKTTEIYYPGPGHSIDNVVVWLPEAGILFGTCAVRSPEYQGRGNVADADVQHWPLAIKKVQRRYSEAEMVVPGHGQPGSVELLQHTIELFIKP